MLGLRLVPARSIIGTQTRLFASLSTRVGSSSKIHRSSSISPIAPPPVMMVKRAFSEKPQTPTEETIPVDLSKLTFREQYKALSLRLLAKQYGSHFVQFYAALYASNFAAALMVAKFFDITQHLRQWLASMSFESMVAFMDKYAEYGDYVTAFVITDLLDVVRVPFFIWYAVRYITKSGKQPLVLKSKLPAHYFENEKK